MNREQVIERIGKKNWKAFLKFMQGQTVGLNKDGSINYYEWDVDKFMSTPLTRDEVGEIIEKYLKERRNNK